MIRASVFVLILGVAVAACSGGSSSDSGSSPTAPTPGSVPFSTTDIRVGTGAEATVGKTANVNYTGWVYSTTAAENKGLQFDSSAGRGTFEFVIGGNVIQGFSQGVAGMKVGGLRRVVIPPSLGYGAQANGAIPANSTLIFEIELVSIR